MRTRAELIIRLDALREQAESMYNALLDQDEGEGGPTVARWSAALNEIDNAAACVNANAFGSALNLLAASYD